MMTRIGISMMAALFGLLSQAAMAHCGKCGCEKAKICNPVHTTKKVKKVVWDCKVVEVCLAGGAHPHTGVWSSAKGKEANPPGNH